MAEPGQLMASHWDDVRFFLAVLREGTFGAAANALGTDQSTVSRRIASLEQALGLSLFERGRRAPTPTDAALLLRESAERVEAELSRFVDDALGQSQQEVAGRVRLAVTEEIAIHFLIPTVLPRLREAHPGLFIDLITSYRAADLVGQEADIALRFFQTERGDLVGRRVARLPTAVLCARSQAARLRRGKSEQREWVAVELPGLVTPEAQWLARSTNNKPPIMICSTYQVQIAAIRAGLGVGIGPAVFAKLDRAFVCLPHQGEPPPVLDLYLVTRRAIRNLPRIVAVMEALGKALATLGA